MHWQYNWYFPFSNIPTAILHPPSAQLPARANGKHTGADSHCQGKHIATHCHTITHSGYTAWIPSQDRDTLFLLSVFSDVYFPRDSDRMTRVMDKRVATCIFAATIFASLISTSAGL